MDDLKFNLTAMSNPSTLAEYSALLDEAISLVDELHEMLDASSREMARRAGLRRPPGS